jgi:hypothetical protein
MLLVSLSLVGHLWHEPAPTNQPTNDKVDPLLASAENGEKDARDEAKDDKNNERSVATSCSAWRTDAETY